MRPQKEIEDAIRRQLSLRDQERAMLLASVNYPADTLLHAANIRACTDRAMWLTWTIDEDSADLKLIP